MKNEEVIIEVLGQISKRLDSMEQRQIADKKEMIDRLSSIEQRQSSDKKEIMDKFSSFESNTNLHFASIQSQLSEINENIRYEKERLDEVYDSRNEVQMKFSRSLFGFNAAATAAIAFIVALFTKS